MATKALWTKRGPGLLALGEHTEELLIGIPDGTSVLTSEPLQERNPYFHRLVMKILSIVVTHTWPQFANINALMDYLKLKSGMVDELEVRPGLVKIRFKSIAFHKMGESEFHKVWEQWGAIIRADLMPGVDLEALLGEATHACN